MSTRAMFRRKAVRIGLAVGAAVTAVVTVFIVQATAASAATSWSINGSTKAWGSTDSGCRITWNVKDNERDGHGAGVRFYVNDGRDRTIDYYNFKGYGKTVSGYLNLRDDAAVAVATFYTEGGKIQPFMSHPKQLC